MAVRITFNGDEVAQAFTDKVERIPGRIQTAMAETAQEVSHQIKGRGDSDISGAGRFGGRWTDSFHADVEGGGTSVAVSVFSTIPYFGVFEYGATIKGQPLLWIPLPFANVPEGTRARDYGPLFRVDRKSGGAPLLFSYSDRQPKYFGKESVTIPQKFHIRDISRSVGETVPTIFGERFRATQ
jgi:hypothetical protein